MRSSMMTTSLSVNSLVTRAAKLFPTSEIVSRLPDKSLVRYSYGEFAERASALAFALTNSGLRVGDRVATLCWNHHWHLEGYFGITLAGGVLHTLNLRLSPEEIRWIAQDGGAEILIVDDILLPLLDKVGAELFKTIIVVPFSSSKVPVGYLDYERWISSHLGKIFVPLPHDETDAIGLCYTSGTTGNPKGVTYSHRSTMLHSLSLCLPDIIGLRCADVVLPVVPMFHVNCWGIPYASIMSGSKLVFPGPHLHAEDLLDLMALEKPTFSLGVPTIWNSILHVLESNPSRYSLPEGLRLAVGGAAVPESLIRAFAARDVTLTQMWGMTETSPIAIVSYATSAVSRQNVEGSFAWRALAGVPGPLVDVRIMSENGEAPWDGVSMGEVQVRGPYIAGGYFRHSEDLEKHTADGWLRTGDIGTIDPRGYLKISDRTKDLIKSGGEWISSVALENALMSHTGIAEAAVIAIPDPKWDERPLACIVLKDGSEVSAEILNKHLTSYGFAKWQLPDRYEAMEFIPRTSTGKFWKLKLREQFPS